MAKYKWIERADELKEQKTKLEAWRALSKEEKSEKYQDDAVIKSHGKKTARLTEPLYVRPFGVAKARNLWLIGGHPVSATALTNQETAGGLISDLVAVVTTGTNVYGLKAEPESAETFKVKKRLIATVRVVETGGN